MDIKIDRFSGEAAGSPIWGYCDNCGGSIYMGSGYFLHDMLSICDGCAKRYAWGLFEAQAKRRHADTELLRRTVR
ncbi:MAG: hypothetical protein ACOX8Q_04385 [Christensenellales bacterium]|jgi:hypothetical protein